MRKLIVLLALVGFTEMLTAQAKKKKPTAKELAAKAKADSDAKAKAAQDAANAKLSETADNAKNKAADLEKSAADKLAGASATDESKINISVWGGYSLHMKSDYTKNIEGMLEDVTTVTEKSVDSTLGGIAGAAEFYYGGNFQFGASIGYLKGHAISRKLNVNGDKVDLQAKMDYIPGIVVMRYFVMPGLYAGAGLGIASVSGGSEKNVRLVNGEIVKVGQTTQVPWEFTFSGTAILAQGRIGYDYSINSNVSVGLTGIFTYLTMELESYKQTAPGVLDFKLEKINNDTLLITPALVVTYKM